MLAPPNDLSNPPSPSQHQKKSAGQSHPPQGIPNTTKMSVRDLDKIMGRLSVNENINPYTASKQVAKVVLPEVIIDK